MSSKSKSNPSKKRPVSPPPDHDDPVSFFDEDPPAPLRKNKGARGGGGTALCKLQGVVTRVREDDVKGPHGNVIKKLRLDVIVTNVDSNGAGDVIVTGVPGENFILPSKVVDTPEAAESEGGFKSKVRELVLEPHSKVRRLSAVSLSFYKDAKGGGAADVTACGIGSTVEIAGVHVNLGVGKNGPAVYLNAGRATPLMSEPPNPGALPAHMIAIAQQPTMQSWGAFGASLPSKGFFNTSGLTTGQKAQAAACQALWQKVTTSTAERLAAIAVGKDQNLGAAIGDHEGRIRATTPAELASGDKLLFITESFDASLAPLVNHGVSPWNKNPPQYKALLAGGEAADALPDSFMMPAKWQISIVGNGLTLEACAMTCFDKDAALEAIDQGDRMPLLTTKTSVLCMSLSMRDIAVRFGTTFKHKLNMLVEQVIPYAEFACFPKVSQLESGGEACNTAFPEGGVLYIDMPKTLAKTGILVSENFIKKELAEGCAQYIADADHASDRYNLPDGVTDMPSFATHRYQELTYSGPSGVGGFKFSNFKLLDGKVKAFHILFPGSVADVAGNKALVDDAALGEAHVLAAAKEAGMEPKDFLTATCAVYVAMN